MRANSLHKAIHLFVTFWTFISILWSIGAAQAKYQRQIVHMALPLKGAFQLRHDSMGKGNYGASRGGGRRTHTGIDLLGNMGDSVMAVGGGRVIYADEKGGYGKMVRIKHVDGSETRYAHLSDIHIKLGQWLHQSQILGSLGKSGNANSKSILPHVHFEWRVNGVPKDPTPFYS